MADREESSLIAARMPRREGIMAFALVLLYLLAAAETSPPGQTITYPWMGTTLLQMLNHAPDVTWRNLFRLNQRTFCRLEDWLATNTDLGGLRGMPLRRKIMIFLLVVGHGFPIRVVGQFVGCSWDAAHRLVLIKRSKYSKRTYTRICIVVRSTMS